MQQQESLQHSSKQLPEKPPTIQQSPGRLNESSATCRTCGLSLDAGSCISAVQHQLVTQRKQGRNDSQWSQLGPSGYLIMSTYIYIYIYSHICGLSYMMGHRNVDSKGAMETNLGFLFYDAWRVRKELQRKLLFDQSKNHGRCKHIWARGKGCHPRKADRDLSGWPKGLWGISRVDIWQVKQPK